MAPTGSQGIVLQPTRPVLGAARSESLGRPAGDCAALTHRSCDETFKVAQTAFVERLEGRYVPRRRRGYEARLSPSATRRLETACCAGVRDSGARQCM